jgi:ABC-2 type transport system permease protein
MIRTIFWKDLRDAIRDGRVLVAILLPVGLGLFYSFIFDAEVEVVRPEAAVALASADPSRLADELRAAAGEGVDLEIRPVADAEEARRLVAEEAVDLGLALPPGFDAAVAGGAAPALSAFAPEGPGGGGFVLGLLGEALRRLAGQTPPAVVQIEAVASAPEESRFIFDRIGPAPYFVVTNAVFVVVMVALFVVPVILTEEAERKTLDALVLIASGLDVVVAKALVGLAYAAVAVALLLGLTRSAPAEPLAFAGALFILAVALIGLGLVLGGVFRSVTQLNTWSSLILIPFVAPVFAVGLPVPGWVEALLAALPTGAGTRLALDAWLGEPFFGDAWRSVLVVAAWAAAAYVLVLWRLARREA